MLIVKYLLSWLLLAIVAVANGILRESTYGKVMPELAAHQVSTLTGMLATGAVIWGLSRIWPLESATQAWIIGALWLLMTVAFEFGFGHFVAGHTWERLLSEYNLLKGRLWLLFLIWVALMPYLCFRATLQSAR